MGDSIYAIVIATNEYGNSIMSASGTGAVMIVAPAAPINLRNDFAVTSEHTIKIFWSKGATNGGSAVTNYTVYCDLGTNGTSFTKVA